MREHHQLPVPQQMTGGRGEGEGGRGAQGEFFVLFLG